MDKLRLKGKGVYVLIGVIVALVTWTAIVDETWQAWLIVGATFIGATSLCVVVARIVDGVWPD